MRIIDAHCDVLSKLLANPKLDFTDLNSDMDAARPKLQQGGVFLQCFAIWLPESIEGPRMQQLLACAELFQTEVVEKGELIFVRTSEDLVHAEQSGRPCAILTIEGADALNGSLANLRTMYRLGARALGLTWNYANWAADGVLEPRKGGLTVKGRALVQECNRLGMTIDVSHLTETGFWETIELSDRPIIASHSNMKPLCDHPRNLTRDQVQAIAAGGGMIGINFYPPFLSKEAGAAIDDVLRHIEAACEWGAERSIGLGSDFDGIGTNKVKGLEDASKYAALYEELAKRYSSEQAERIVYRNWLDYWLRELPKSEC